MKDVFLSHAGPEKEHVVKPFAQELERRGITYWLDEAEILWGDKISKRINEGLKEARFVIVFLSESFVDRNWPETELDAALARENSQGQTIVLPIVIGDPSSILAPYPLLRGKAYLRWDLGVSTLVDYLQKRLASIIEPAKVEKVKEKDWRRPLAEILDKYGRIAKESDPELEAGLNSILGRVLNSDLHYSEAKEGISELCQTTLHHVQEGLDVLLQDLSKAEEEVLDAGRLESRIHALCRVSMAKVSACCRRETLPIRSEALEFYTEIAKRVKRWMEEFFDDDLSVLDLILWGIIRSVPSRVTRKMGRFLSSKIGPLVGDWRTESLHGVIRTVVGTLEPEIDVIIADFHEGLREEGIQIAGRSDASFRSSLPMLASWIEKKVTFRWATLFNDRSSLMVIQALAAGVKGTPQEKLQAVLIREILETGDKQDSSFPEDLANHIIHKFLPVEEAKDIAKEVASEQKRRLEWSLSEIRNRVDQKRKIQQQINELEVSVRDFWL